MLKLKHKEGKWTTIIVNGVTFKMTTNRTVRVVWDAPPEVRIVRDDAKERAAPPPAQQEQ